MVPGLGGGGRGSRGLMGLRVPALQGDQSSVDGCGDSCPSVRVLGATRLHT